jgi:hypothetical protein
MNITGWPSGTKLDRVVKKTATVEPTGLDQYGLTVVSHTFTTEVAASEVIDAGSTISVINDAGHQVKAGDTIIFAGNITAALADVAIRVSEVDTNTFTLAADLPVAPAALDEYSINRFKAAAVDNSGGIISGPVTYDLDGASVTVHQDTVDPTNNRGLPVKLMNLAGDVNIQANDINVSTVHTADSMRLGDGTALIDGRDNGGVRELHVHDLENNAVLDSLLTELQAKADLTETQPVSAASLPLPTGAATEATLASLAAEDFATQTTLAALLTELQGKADLIETQPVSAASLPLPTGAATEATLASLAAEDFATQTTLAALLTELQLKADLTETQPVSAASLPLPSGAATETTLSSLLTELQAKADLAETQPVSAASLPLPSGAATETTLGNLLTELQAKADLTETQPVSIAATLQVEQVDRTVVDQLDTPLLDAGTTTIPDNTGNAVAVVASLAADCKGVYVADTIGQFVGVYNKLSPASATDGLLFIINPGMDREIPVAITNGTAIYLRSMDGNSFSDAGSRLIMQFLG